MEQLHLEIKTIENPSDIEAYTNPHNPYVILTQDYDCDLPDIRICRTVGDVIDNYNSMRKNDHQTPIFIEELINHEDYGEEVVNYVVSCLKNLDDCPSPFWGISQATECEVEWENIDNPDFSCKFTTDLDGGIDME